MRVGECQSDAVEVEHADVGPAEIVDRLVRDPCRAVERLVEVAEGQVADERLADAAPARVGGLAPGDRPGLHATPP
jgi:hypothetical protein